MCCWARYLVRERPPGFPELMCATELKFGSARAAGKKVRRPYLRRKTAGPRVFLHELGPLLLQSKVGGDEGEDTHSEEENDEQAPKGRERPEEQSCSEESQNRGTREEEGTLW